MHKVCPKCRRDQEAEEYTTINSKYAVGGRAEICNQCLMRLTDSSDLGEVSKLLQYLDRPFLINQWTRLYDQYKDKTLLAYLKIVDEDEGFETLDWESTNEKWHDYLKNKGTLEHEVYGCDKVWMNQMMSKWPSDMERSAEDYKYLEDLYQDLVNTQNLVTATQRDDAKRLCEVGLLINKKIRAGLDAKNEMAIYHNIIKTEGFEPKNSKNAGDFDSVGRFVLTLNLLNCGELLYRTIRSEENNKIKSIIYNKYLLF